jgi:hypothetical protein
LADRQQVNALFATNPADPSSLDRAARLETKFPYNNKDLKLISPRFLYVNQDVPECRVTI